MYRAALSLCEGKSLDFSLFVASMSGGPDKKRRSGAILGIDMSVPETGSEKHLGALTGTK